METVKGYEKKFDKVLGQYPIALQLERQTGINKVHLVFLAFLALVFLGLYRAFPHTILSIVLFAYPAWQTIQAIDRHDKAADVHWLTYWLSIGTIMTLEGVIGSAWVHAKIPAYNPLLMVLGVWMWHPKTKGSVVVYENSIRPIYIQLSALVCSSCKSLGLSCNNASNGSSSKMHLAKAAAAARESVSQTKEAAVKAASQTKEATVKAANDVKQSVEKDLSSLPPLPPPSSDL